MRLIQVQEALLQELFDQHLIQPKAVEYGRDDLSGDPVVENVRLPWDQFVTLAAALLSKKQAEPDEEDGGESVSLLPYKLVGSPGAAVVLRCTRCKDDNARTMVYTYHIPDGEYSLHDLAVKASVHEERYH